MSPGRTHSVQTAQIPLLLAGCHSGEEGQAHVLRINECHGRPGRGPANRTWCYDQFCELNAPELEEALASSNVQPMPY
jgi:hypothetical protein